MPVITLTVNGSPVSRDIPANMLLVHFIRDIMSLTGTHVGCDTSQCGACAIHVNGKPVKSCAMLAVQADGCDIVTIEGLAPNDNHLHPMQQAFHDHHGLQCGFCTPGMVMTAVAFAREHPDPAEDDVRSGLEGNLCRCTGYQNIVDAVLAGTKAMQETN